jgi:hypothetical protein
MTDHKVQSDHGRDTIKPDAKVLSRPVAAQDIELKLSISDKGSWRCSIGESECCCMISRGYIQL